MLNLALIALGHLRKNGGFIKRSIEEIRKEYEKHSNGVKAFVHQNCLVTLSESKLSVPTVDLYKKYVQNCEEIKEKCVDITVFGKILSEMGIERIRFRENGDRKYYYAGIRLR